MIAARRQKGFMLIEIVIALSVLVVVLTIAFNLMQLTFKLQNIGLSQASALQNQTLIMQRINQQVSIYGRTVSIQTGESDRLIVNDVAGNRLVAFYTGNETEGEGTAVLYMSIQMPPEAAGANQLSDPNNVAVTGFKAYKLDAKRIKVTLSLHEKTSGRTFEFVELITLLNGEVL